MRIEYDSAVAAAQMAAKWRLIQDQKKDLPLLKYKTVGDARVRPQHRALNNVIKPVDDSFWDSYYPPNGWNCRCTVVQLAEGEITANDKIPTIKDVPDLFRNNVGKTGEIFTDKHPFFTIPADEWKEALNKLGLNDTN